MSEETKTAVARERRSLSLGGGKGEEGPSQSQPCDAGPQQPRADFDAEPSGGWRPIETAPKDGTEIIAVRFGRYFDLNRVWWQPEFDAWISGCREMVTGPGYTFEDGSTRQLHSPEIMTPTHWMPLPPSPSENRSLGAEGGEAAAQPDAEHCSSCGASVSPGCSYYCDESPGGPWCASCFSNTPCGRDEHDEGCMTMVMSDGR